MNSKVPLVSVAITTYNQKNFLRECIESVLIQDYPNIEIVIADDASTDGTQAMLKDYADRYPGKFVLRLSEKNKGIAQNSNASFLACTGIYVAIIAGDDLMLPGKISAQVNWLEQDKKRVLCGHLLHICDEASRVTGVHSRKLISGVGPKHWLSEGTIYGACSIMIRRENAPQVGYDERLKFVSDWKFFVDSISEDSIYGYLPKIYGMYRRHANNITNSKLLILNDIELTIELLREEYPKYRNHIQRKGRPSLDYAYGIFYMLNGQLVLAIKHFLCVISRAPLKWKAYIRLLQTLSSMFCRKLVYF